MQVLFISLALAIIGGLLMSRIAKKLNLPAEECLMVGNDVQEDMVAVELGMQVFLLTDCIINSENRNTDPYPQGSFPELMDFIRALKEK